MSVAPHAGSPGTACELPEAQIKDDLVRIGRGTPMGELLRRYRHPAGLARDSYETPKKSRALGEDLVLFAVARGSRGCCMRAAATVGRRSTTARSRSAASAGENVEADDNSLGDGGPAILFGRIEAWPSFLHAV